MFIAKLKLLIYSTKIIFSTKKGFYFKKFVIHFIFFDIIINLKYGFNMKLEQL